MKQALAAAALILLASVAFLWWIAEDMAPRADFVPHAEPPQAAEIDYLRAVYSPLHVGLRQSSLRIHWRIAASEIPLPGSGHSSPSADDPLRTMNFG